MCARTTPWSRRDRTQSAMGRTQQAALGNGRGSGLSAGHPFQTRIRSAELVRRTGRVRKIMPTHIEADGPNVCLGALCKIEERTSSGTSMFEAQVIKVDE